MTQSHLYQHAQAFLLALASSTDNFLVGLSVGLGQRPLSNTLLWGIACCNATGSFVATAGGGLGVQALPLLASMQYVSAATAFGYLAWKEFRESRQEAKRISNSLSELAIPMTLNNLAGGVAGGVVGLKAWIASVHALFVSVAAMWIGHFLGKGYRRTVSSSSTAIWSVLLYLALSLQSLYQAFQEN